MTYRYRAFGLTIGSDVPFVELLPEPDLGRPVDLVIRAGEVPFAQPFPGRMKYTEDQPDSLLLDFSPYARFLVHQGHTLIYQQAEDCDPDQFRLLALSPALSAALLQRGLIVLHGSCVSLDGHTCQVILGDSGMGKSTLAAHHFLQHHTILSDDFCAISFDASGDPVVFPSYPQLKLWQSSADLLQIDTQPLRRVQAGQDKFALPIHSRFGSRPLPLIEIQELVEDTVPIRAQAGYEKVHTILRHTFRYRYILRMDQHANYLNLAVRLAEKMQIHLCPRLALGEGVVSIVR